MGFSAIEDAIEDIRQGKMVVVVDDEDRENEGDIIIAAEHVTPEAINFMATYAKGLICTPMEGERLDALNIPQMVANNTDHHETAFTVFRGCLRYGNRHIRLRALPDGKTTH